MHLGVRVWVRVGARASVRVRLPVGLGGPAGCVCGGCMCVFVLVRASLHFMPSAIPPRYSRWRQFQC